MTATFAFSHPEGNVGVPLESQLVLSSQAHAGSASIHLAQVRVIFEGGLKNIGIYHRPVESNGKELSSGPIHVQRISLQTSSFESGSTPTSPSFVLPNTLSAFADLALAAGETKTISFSQLPRDDGNVEVSSITTYIEEEGFELELVVSEDEQLHHDSFWLLTNSGVTQKALKSQRSSAVKILPKPPKMRIGLPDMLRSYYVDEDVIFDIETANDEDEPATGTLEVRFLGPPGTHAKVAWASESVESNFIEGTTPKATDEDGLGRLPTKQIAAMEPGARQTYQLHIKAATEPAEYSLRVEARYSLLSDPETPISKVFSADVAFIQPFEATFNFAPRIHPNAWPSYFDIEGMGEGQREGDDVKGNGLSQRWSLSSRLTSIATESLIIEDISPKVNHMTPSETATCRISPSNSITPLTQDPSNSTTFTLAPGALHSYAHTLDVQKLDLEDRQSFSIDLYLQIQYRRQSAPSQTIAAETTTTILPIPPHPLPFSEPRCLAWTPEPSPLTASTTPPSIPLTYTLENPSSYTLTFSLTMDNNEAFAFSGPKSLTIQLLPLSRRAVEYRLLPLGTSEDGHQKGEERGRWIWPHCVVVDTGFRKTLRVLPAAEGLRAGRRGEVGLWVKG